jgi:uncharacterized membrane protein YfcA
MNRTLVIAIIGAISGIINGLTGLGHAGAILFGLLVSGVINEYNTIIGTTLYSQLLPVVVFGVLEYYKRDQIDFYAGNILLVTLLVFVFIGAWLKQYISDRITKFITAFLLLLTSFKFFYDAFKNK